MISIARDLATLNQAVDLTLPTYVWIICFYWLLLPTKFDPKLWSRNLLMLLPSTCSNHSSLLLFFVNVAQAPRAFYALVYLPGHLSHIFQRWPAILIWVFRCSCGHISLKTVNSFFSPNGSATFSHLPLGAAMTLVSISSCLEFIWIPSSGISFCSPALLLRLQTA